MAILTPDNLPNVVQNMPDPSSQIQHAGVDLTVEKIERFVDSGFLAINNSDRKLPETEMLTLNETDSFDLQPGGYIVRYNEMINVPLDAAAITLPRSSLMRCGATLHSALWDPGYQGYGMALLSVYHRIKIQKDSRIGQIVFFSLAGSVSHGYSGAYQGEGTVEKE